MFTTAALNHKFIRYLAFCNSKIILSGTGKSFKGRMCLEKTSILFSLMQCSKCCLIILCLNITFSISHNLVAKAIFANSPQSRELICCCTLSLCISILSSEVYKYCKFVKQFHQLFVLQKTITVQHPIQ